MHLRVPERAGLESVWLLFFALSLKRSGDCPVERFRATPAGEPHGAADRCSRMQNSLR